MTSELRTSIETAISEQIKAHGALTWVNLQKILAGKYTNADLFKCVSEMKTVRQIVENGEWYYKFK